MPLDIKVFQVLDEIARRHKIKALMWAEAAWGDTKYQSRISELRGLLKSAGDDEPTYTRVFSHDKMFALASGLRELIGAETLVRAIADRLRYVDSLDARDRVVLLAAALPAQKTMAAEAALAKILLTRK